LARSSVYKLLMLGIWQRAYVGKAAVKVKADMPVHVVGRDGIAAVGPAL